MWQGIQAGARAHDLNVLYFAGDQIRGTPDSVIFDLLAGGRVHGIVSWAAFVQKQMPDEAVAQFFADLHPIPAVIIEQVLPGIPAIVLDNVQGTRAALSHLIDDHGLRRVMLYGADTPSFQLRNQAYQQIMQEYGLQGPFLDWHDLRPIEEDLRLGGSGCQGILLADEHVAVDVVRDLHKLGLRIPEDIALMGFNDGHTAQVTTPPMTTMRIPFFEMGSQAVDLLVEHMAGRPVAETTTMPMQLVVRESCGCMNPLTAYAAAGIPGEIAPKPTEMLWQELAPIIQNTALKPVDLADLLGSFWADINSPAGSHSSFLRCLKDWLNRDLSPAGTVNWHQVLSMIRRALLPALKDGQQLAAEDLWQQARVQISQTEKRQEAYQRWLVQQQEHYFGEIQAAILVVFEMEELLTVLAEGLPRLGIEKYYLALYENVEQPDGFARLLLSGDQQGRIILPEEHLRFPATDILPASLVAGQAQTFWLVEPLHFLDEQIGYIVFETTHGSELNDGAIYTALRQLISSALKGVFLRQNLREAWEKAEEANLLKSRFLSMVSHELRTPLNLIVGLSEMSLRESSRELQNLEEINQSLRAYQQKIYDSGRHLDHLIRDVLDLASSQVGQLKLLPEPLALQEVLRETIPVGEQMALQKGLDFQVSLPPVLPFIYGDRNRLRQVILNLLVNAVKFTQNGFVSLTVTEGDGTVTVTVRDSGLGVPPDDQPHIFDEFRRSDRSITRGFGGMGLGLAITRRLVELHGGTIGVQSSGVEGEGSSFFFTLPVIAHELPDHLSDFDQPQQVLIIRLSGKTEDDLEAYLKKHGISASQIILQDQPDWLSQVIAIAPDTIILDCSSSTEQGWELVKTLKEHPSTRQATVLFYSILSEKGNILPLDLQAKPLQSEQLNRALDQYQIKSSTRDHPLILVADDEPGIRQLHARLVQEILPSSEVIEAADGREALKLAQEALPDLVLLDLNMPEMDGFTLLEELRKGETTREIPVLVLTARVLDEEDIARLNRAVAAILTKGIFSVQETYDQIESAIQRQRRLGNEAQRLVRRALAYIHSHYAEDISRSAIARHLGVNEDYLARCFDTELHITPLIYLNRYRLLQARRLLESSDASITEVALAVGFSSPSYFARIFQREVGISPREYKRGERSKTTQKSESDQNESESE